MDFSRAFDLLHPGVTEELLLYIGWPPDLVAILPLFGRSKRVSRQAFGCACFDSSYGAP